MNLLTNIAKTASQTSANYSHTYSNAIGVAIASASCMNQQEVSTAYFGLEQRDAEAMPGTVEAGTSKCYESANNMNSRQIVKTKKINKKYMCATCSISFDNSSALNVHLKNVHANKEFWEKCSDCSKSFASYASLKIHRHKKHNSEYQPNKRIECGGCGIWFEKVSCYKAHIRTKKHKKCIDALLTNTDKKSTQVSDDPPAGSDDSKTTEKHKERDYTCSYCKNKFINFFDIKKHLFKEHKKNRYHCHLCNKNFSRRDNLNVHISEIHTKNIRHKCPVCQKGFYRKSAMEFHLGRHNSDSALKFSCYKCPNMFSRIVYLKKHLKKRHNIIHKCYKCLHSFTSLSALTEHINEKHDVNLKCDECIKCGVSFAKKISYVKHLKTKKHHESVRSYAISSAEQKKI